MDMLDHVWLGVLAVFQGPSLIEIAGFGIPVTLVMVAAGFITGVLVGATPGLAGPMAMAVSLPILISVFGFETEALLPVMGFLIGVMKGATIGGAVPAILFNTPGTPDAVLTTIDGHPMTRAGQSGKALKVAHFASVSGDTVSDIVLFVCAPFLAVLVERYLDLPEKTALILFSLAFIAAVVGESVAKGMIAMGLGMLAAFVGTGEDFYPRLTGGASWLAQGFSLTSAVLGVLIVGEIFRSLEDMMRERAETGRVAQMPAAGDSHLPWRERRKLFPFIANSAAIGTLIGALPGIGSTLAATIGYASGRRMHPKRQAIGPEFGKGAPEGVAATEAANSAVSGANLIPVLSLGIPGNAAAVFLILATESIGGFNPGPAVFRIPSDGVNPEMVLAFGIFTAMTCANILNWLIGGRIMRAMSVMIRIPKQVLLPCVLLVTLTAIYVQETSMSALVVTLGFGVLGYLFRRLEISVLPFVIAFILAGNLESTARQAFSATGGDPWFLLSSPLALTFVVCGLGIVLFLGHSKDRRDQNA
ncbi:MAG: tripartite tricarboxylate transporter permease [Pseudomonadota bacterium]